MSLATQLWTTITSDFHECKTISIIPGDDQFITAADATTGTLEIGLSKDVYLKLFQECHHQQHVELTPWDEYIMTVGYLVTTNENYTILNRHVAAVDKIISERPQFLQQEIDFISTLLASRLKRINKSPTLWHLFRRLVVKQRLPLSQTLMLRVKASLCNHFANYYATNFLRWYVSVLLDQGEDIEGVVDMVVQLAKANIGDVSLWLLIGFILVPEPDYYIQDYKRLGGVLQHRFDGKSGAQRQWSLMIGKGLLHWLGKIDCRIEYPFVVLYQLLGERVFDEVMQNFRSDVIVNTTSAFQ